MKWVFTAWLEGTCSETCGDRRWSLTRCDHLKWHGGLKVCLHAAQLSAALLKTCSVSCGVSWPDEARGNRGLTFPSILLSVLSGWNASSGGSDYREGERCFLRTSLEWGESSMFSFSFLFFQIIFLGLLCLDLESDSWRQTGNWGRESGDQVSYRRLESRTFLLEIFRKWIMDIIWDLRQCSNTITLTKHIGCCCELYSFQGADFIPDIQTEQAGCEATVTVSVCTLKWLSNKVKPEYDATVSLVCNESKCKSSKKCNVNGSCSVSMDSWSSFRITT